MAKEKGADQTEQPTHKRLKDARKDGEVHRSQDLSRTFLLLLWLLMFWLLATYLFNQIDRVFSQVLSQIPNTTSFNDIVDSIHLSIDAFTKIMLPFVLVAAIVGLALEALQVGGVFAPKRMVPKLERLNPAEGIKRMISKEHLVEVLKAVFKTAALITIVVLVVKALLSEYLLLVYGPVTAILPTHWRTILWAISGTVFVFFFISVLDVIYQRHVFIKNLMMSRRDIKDEQKDSEGDPMMKNQRRQLHQEWSQQNSLAAVRKSNVVVVNPTHYAVALYYEQGETDLPMVVAKGEGYMARQIRQIAEEENIPIMRHVDLAQGLYRNIEEDCYISSDFFSAVAEVLYWAENVRQEEENERYAEWDSSGPES